jgi:hypothetical protein
MFSIFEFEHFKPVWIIFRNSKSDCVVVYDNNLEQCDHEIERTMVTQ